MASCTPKGSRPAVHSAIDPIPVTLTCATRCTAPKDGAAACDSYLNTNGPTVADLQVQRSHY